jgi:hypothetical protein
MENRTKIAKNRMLIRIGIFCFFFFGCFNQVNPPLYDSINLLKVENGFKLLQKRNRLTLDGKNSYFFPLK